MRMRVGQGKSRQKNNQASGRESGKNRMFLRLISVVLGMIIWLTVVNISNPEVTRTKTVPLTILNGDVLTRAGKVYTIQSGETVTVSYQVRSRDAYRIEADTFRASVDLANMYSVTGSVPVIVETVKNKELISGTPAARPGVIRVSMEDLQNKSFAVSSSTEGDNDPEFSVGSVTLSPETIMVSGPMSMVGRISSVGIIVDVSGHTDDFTGTATPVFYDANGNEIEITDERLETDPEEISYAVDMLRGKVLTLQFQVSGNAAPGYRYTGAESSVKSIPVIGESELLASINELVIPGSALSVEGATESQYVNVDLSKYLPAGISVDGNSEATVLLKVQALNTKALQLSLESGIEVSGREEGQVYSIYPNLVSVELSGLPQDLETITSEALNARLDLSGLVPGSYTGRLGLAAPPGTTIASVTPFTIIVTEESTGPGGQIVTDEHLTNAQDMPGIQTSETVTPVQGGTEIEPAGQESTAGEETEPAAAEQGAQESSAAAESAPAESAPAGSAGEQHPEQGSAGEQQPGQESAGDQQHMGQIAPEQNAETSASSQEQQT